MAFGLHLIGVSTKTNTTGEFTPIIEYKVPAGNTVIWPKSTRQIMKLYDDNGDELPNRDELYWAYKLPAEKTYTPLTEVFMYQKHKKMGLQDQSDVNKTPKIQMSVPAQNALRAQGGKAGIVFAQDREIALFLDSDQTFDKDQDDNYIELPDVEVT